MKIDQRDRPVLFHLDAANPDAVTAISLSLAAAAVPSSPAQERKVLKATALTLRNILNDERGEKQPIGRLMWLLQLCVERADLALALPPSSPVADSPTPCDDSNHCNPYSARCGAKFCTQEDRDEHEETCGSAPSPSAGAAKDKDIKKS